MRDWWTEFWSVGDGRTRMSCGIAQTPEGFAVDVFEGDTCVASEVHSCRQRAENAALDLKLRYLWDRGLEGSTVH